LKTLITRGLSGAVYVIAILIPLLWWNAGWPWMVAAFTFLLLPEMYRLIFKAYSKTVSLRFISLVSIVLIWGFLPMAILAVMPYLTNLILPAEGYSLTLSMFLMVWAFDTFAYLLGKGFGRHKLAPSISPLKTVEGALGGFFFTVVLSIILSYLPGHSFSILFWVGAVLIISIAGTLGDIAESKVKRKAGVKDSGRLMPGHGGIFDRFDSLLFIIPLWQVWIYLAVRFGF
jgi:CDP-diglyceride synthetase